MASKCPNRDKPTELPTKETESNAINKSYITNLYRKHLHNTESKLDFKRLPEIKKWEIRRRIWFLYHAN
jgi:hypothetical protein